jgi:hypothetical protein
MEVMQIYKCKANGGVETLWGKEKDGKTMKEAHEKLKVPIYI